MEKLKYHYSMGVFHVILNHTNYFKSRKASDIIISLTLSQYFIFWIIQCSKPIATGYQEVLKRKKVGPLFDKGWY